jgi:hypothetical protein
MDRFSVISTTYENEESIITARGYKPSTAKQVVQWAGAAKFRRLGSPCRSRRGRCC